MASVNFNSWVLLWSLVLCVIFGASVLAVVTYAHFKTLKIAIPSLLFALLGGFLMTSPKWTEVAFKWGEWEGRVAATQKLEQDVADAKAKLASLTTVEKELDSARNQIAELKNEKFDILARLQVKNAELTKLSNVGTTLVANTISKKFELQNEWIALKAKIEKCPTCPAGDLTTNAETASAKLTGWTLDNFEFVVPPK